MAKRYSEECKRIIVEQYRLGSSVKEVCAQNNIARSTLLLWVKQYTADEGWYGLPLVFHSDQGTQYTSFEFCNLLKQHKITQSFSAPGSPHDNAVAESFFATIKKEDFCRNYYKTEEEFRTAVAEYIEFYNDYRPHQRLGFLTPNQAEKEFCHSTAE